MRTRSSCRSGSSPRFSWRGEVQQRRADRPAPMRAFPRTPRSSPPAGTPPPRGRRAAARRSPTRRRWRQGSRPIPRCLWRAIRQADAAEAVSVRWRAEDLDFPAFLPRARGLAISWASRGTKGLRGSASGVRGLRSPSPRSAVMSTPRWAAAMGRSEWLVNPGIVLISRNHGPDSSSMKSARARSRQPRRRNRVSAARQQSSATPAAAGVREGSRASSWKYFAS